MSEHRPPEQRSCPCAASPYYAGAHTKACPYSPKSRGAAQEPVRIPVSIVEQRRVPKIPYMVTLRLSRAQRMYVSRLVADGLHGNTVAQTVDIIFCRGLQDYVPVEWYRDAMAGKRA